MMRRLFIFLFLLGGALHASVMVEGVIYMKDGTVVEYYGSDRVKIPKNAARKVTAYKNAYARKGKKRVSYAAADIDSLVCRHPQAKEYRRKFVYVDRVGWCWVYVDTPYIEAYVFSKKGYEMYSNGGISLTVVEKALGARSRVSVYLRKTGCDDVLALGGMYKKPGDAFIEKVCGYISDDPGLCRAIREKVRMRSKTIAMLAGYTPGR